MLAVGAGPDRIEHARIGDRGRVALALQNEFVIVDAARHIGGQHQQQIDFLAGAGRQRRIEAAPTAACKTNGAGVTMMQRFPAIPTRQERVTGDQPN